MRHRLIVTTLAISAIVLFAAFATPPDEGMWLLTQLEKLPFERMGKLGLELKREQIYNPNGTSIKDAIVQLPGGTGSFVSADGLIITNHHIAFGAIQSVSSVQDDYLKNGVNARTHPEEISVPSYTARIVASVKDVTTEILSAVSDTMAPENRARALQAKISEVQKAAKGKGDLDWSVSETYNGVKYFLYSYEVLRDVRLVYAPPSSIGNYGGEVDNWTWPRHTGDFGFMRAYVGPDGKPAKYAKENVPYKPKAFLPISSKPLEEHSFAMVMGFPGRTFRYRTSPEIRLAREETLPLTIDLYKARMDIMEEAGRNDRAIEIKYASAWRRLANAYKNYQGTLEGMKRSNLLGLRLEKERMFTERLLASPELAKQYGGTLTEIAEAYEKFKGFNKKQIVLGQVYGSSDVLGIALRFRSFANGFAKDSSTGEMRPAASSVQEMKEYLAGAFKDVDLGVDKAQFAAMLLKAAELPADQRLRTVEELVGNRTGQAREKAVKEHIDDLYEGTSFATPQGCASMLTRSAEDILDDDMLKFAKQLDADNAPLIPKVAAFNASIARLRARLLEATMTSGWADYYPDANRTLRITYGEIKSYIPRNAVRYNFLTTLTGLMEKETGEDPFIVPPGLRELWAKKDFGPYADPKLGDVPVGFLANLDITGGNSGSPVINGKGDLIGVAFDGNWEAVVGDYIFQEPLNRSINVDSRYVLFLLDKFSHADNLLKELVIH